jgi:hypothetical protein
MNPDLSEKVLEKIEALCTSGCTQVNELLQQDSENIKSAELSGFTEAERAQILHELKNIMSVYDEKDC